MQAAGMPLLTPAPGSMQPVGMQPPGMASMPVAGMPVPTPAPGSMQHSAQPPTHGSGAMPSSGRFSAGRSVPVPNHPGAVPIVMAMSAPPIPSGGTLVSSATQAGNLPPAVKPVMGPHGESGLDGFAGQNVQSFANTQGGFGGQGMQVGFGSLSSPGDPSASGQTGPGAFASSYTGDADQVRASQARPTMQIRSQGGSKLPMIGLVLVGVAGIVVGGYFVLGRSNEASSPPASMEPVAAPPSARGPSEAPDRSDPGKVAEPGQEPSKPAPGSQDTRRVADPGTAGADPSGAAPDMATNQTANPGAAKTAEPPANAADPPAKVPALIGNHEKLPDPSLGPRGPGETAVPDDPTRAKPGKLVQEPHSKAAKPKVRPESKRGDKRPRKEQTWSPDSPFLPDTPAKR
jgi:hypothetical protein